MTLWNRLANWVQAQTMSLGDFFNSSLPLTPESDRLTLALIGLCAKIAKADGDVSLDEVRAVARFIELSENDLKACSKVFDYAAKDADGYEEFAERIATAYGRSAPELTVILQGLITIAGADKEYHICEQAMIARIAEIFGVDLEIFKGYLALVGPQPRDPYAVLEVTPAHSLKEIETAYHQLVRRFHPDLLIAKGAPEDIRKQAEQRLQEINQAISQIRENHKTTSA